MHDVKTESYKETKENACDRDSGGVWDLPTGRIPEEEDLLNFNIYCNVHLNTEYIYSLENKMLQIGECMHVHVVYEQASVSYVIQIFILKMSLSHASAIYFSTLPWAGQIKSNI